MALQMYVCIYLWYVEVGGRLQVNLGLKFRIVEEG